MSINPSKILSKKKKNPSVKKKINHHSLALQPLLLSQKKKKYLIKFRPDSGYVFKTRPGLRIAIKKFKLQVVYSGSVYATPFHNNHNSLFKKKKKLIKI